MMGFSGKAMSRASYEDFAYNRELREQFHGKAEKKKFPFNEAVLSIIREVKKKSPKDMKWEIAGRKNEERFRKLSDKVIRLLDSLDKALYFAMKYEKSLLANSSTRSSILHIREKQQEIRKRVRSYKSYWEKARHNLRFDKGGIFNQAYHRYYVTPVSRMLEQLLHEREDKSKQLWKVLQAVHMKQEGRL
jgi:hypothetical protein